MATTYIDASLTDDERRRRMFCGDVFVYSPTSSSKAFCEFSREMICAAFGDQDPETAQDRMSVQEYVAVLSELKPQFIHHPRSKEFVREILREIGCDLSKTYFDVPRMRTSTSDGYLTSGIAYAWHPHRDTWYSAPAAQINFWVPIFPILSTNAMAFHPTYFSKIVPNDSERYNYYEWNRKYRAAAATQTDGDSRPLPRPTDPVDTEYDIRVICPVGGIIIFSGAQLHSSVPNTSGVTRFSIDFRTVNVEDIRKGEGAPTQDVKCTGSSIRDFVSCEDLSAMPADIIRSFHDGTEESGDLVYDRSAEPG